MSKLEATEIAIAELRKDIEYIKNMLEDGFKRIYKKQDELNLEINRQDKILTSHDGMMNSFRDKYMTKDECTNMFFNGELKNETRLSDVKSKIIWYGLGISGTVIGALCISLITSYIKNHF